VVFWKQLPSASKSWWVTSCVRLCSAVLGTEATLHPAVCCACECFCSNFVSFFCTSGGWD
jgi:hypothetical protein